MKIGIIGAGMIGGTLTRRLTALGHDVSVSNSRGPETLTDLAAETGATATTADQALDGAELVVLTIPEAKVTDLPVGLFDRLSADVPVVDTGNYYPARDGRIVGIEDGLTESGWVSEQIGRPVVKAFNNIHARDLLELGRRRGAGDRVALPVAGDEPGTKEKVLHLVDELGFDPVDAGGIDESWRQQPGTPGYAANYGRGALINALAEASPERPASFRASEIDSG